MDITRRNLMATVGGLSAGLIVGNSFAVTAYPKGNEKDMESEVTAIEDLMREQGVLRRILIIYSESAKKLSQVSISEVNEPLNKAAKLFRDFGENYHGKQLEENFIFQ
ncbi:MAG TPA: hypothetical protein DDX75_05275 [Phycisphaerales bacterium]|nr:hypothetical protein [Phycisphaerales bacterium]